MISTRRIFLSSTIAATVFMSCRKDKDPIIVVPPSSGSQVEFNGLTGNEPSGSSAGNAVYLDLSTNQVTAIARASWDLGFYGGPEFRVVLNNTTSAGAKLLTQNDLLAVGAADTVGLTLAIDQNNPGPADFAYFDKLDGSLTGTVIPEISANDANNKVIIINRGTGGSTAPRPWMKIRVLRNTSGGYTLQYANITATTFQTIQVAKDDNFHFKLVSFDNGVISGGQPEKSRWDLVWSYSVYQTFFPIGGVPTAMPYNFSDLISVNHLSNVQVKEKVYADAATAAAAYTAFNRDSVSLATNAVEQGRWTIGSGWRSTQPATGARLDKFYIIRDAAGNYYKFKCLSMGVGADGGTRGKPRFQYDLIP